MCEGPKPLVPPVKVPERPMLRAIRGGSLPASACVSPFSLGAQGMKNLEVDQLSNNFQKWQQGLMSTYDYLLYLNLIAGRSFQDLNQFPIFPWVLSDYTSSTLDLSNPNSFRDLSLPIGALNSERRAQLQEQYQALNENYQQQMVEQKDSTMEVPKPPQPYHHGTHYSNALYVTHWLVRHPHYTPAHLKYHDDKFDRPGRLFGSVGRAFEKAQTGHPFELIPHFYMNVYDRVEVENEQKQKILSPGEAMLLNAVGLPLGK